MSQHEQYYLVPGRLTDDQETNMRSELLGGPILGPADMFARMVGIVGTPIQPCTDVETVGFVPDKSDLFVDKRLPMTNIYRSAGDPWPVPLVRRTDMEAQIALTYEKGWSAGKRDASNQQARVAAEKDAVTGRLKEVLTLFTEYEKLMDSGEDVAGMMVYADLQKQVRAALNEGAAE